MALLILPSFTHACIQVTSINVENDLDGDGVIDFVVASKGDDKIRWYSQEVRERERASRARPAAKCDGVVLLRLYHDWPIAITSTPRQPTPPHSTPPTHPLTPAY